ncbi:hypothetical protein [Mycobacterium aquaticum]|uniref:hypothetical protein n=1 Tax=Mycobacterium aquaticum TaxID=1927124 RepID=UPI00114EF1FC|nr:hypothetical protein [Mycobacterium aquaticum]
MIAVTVAITLSVSGRGGKDDGKAVGPGGSQSPAVGSNVASANDTGPATIITDEPTCAGWAAIEKAVNDAEAKTDWSNHDYKTPVSDWTPELRAKYDTMSKALTATADQAVALAKKTPHRVVRELYEQFIAYARAFVSSLGTYAEIDQQLANASVHARVGFDYVCDAITWKSAVTHAPFVSDPAPPTTLAKPGDPGNQQRALESSSGVDCAKWNSVFDKFGEDTKGWSALDPKLSVDEWRPDQRAAVDAVIPVMQKYADDIETLGRASGNATIEDFSVLGAQYWRAYADALPTYAKTDAFLSLTAARMPSFVVVACKAVGG